ncbi:DinB family protein [Micromonospora sp. FIMYZ51]|uniref:DinB family protein n=1 Tax=Micromonospora sp. FIMYZ51 TaxID=3051832 RepID=UPI00311E5966
MVDVDAEKAALHEFLTCQRDSVRAILSGLDERALRMRVLPSGWTPLGLVEHLAHAERHWFQEVLTGSVAPLPWPDTGDAPLTTSRSPAVVFDFYRDQCELSDRIIAVTALTASPAGRHPGEPLAAQTTDLRRIILHMIEETARHAGHLDVARELIDGRTGLGPR